MTRFKLAAVLFLALAAGCASQTLQQQATIAASDAVLGVVTTSHDPKAEAGRIVAIASDIKHTAETGIDVADIQRLSDVVASHYLKPDEQTTARVITAIVVNHARASIGAGATGIIPPGKLDDLRAFVAALCDSAIQTAQPFTK